jgi:hypothetical protein
MDTSKVGENYECNRECIKDNKIRIVKKKLLRSSKMDTNGYIKVGKSTDDKIKNFFCEKC